MYSSKSKKKVSSPHLALTIHLSDIFEDGFFPIIGAYYKGLICFECFIKLAMGSITCLANLVIWSSYQKYAAAWQLIYIVYHSQISTKFS
jgi:hypothetical protein